MSRADIEAVYQRFSDCVASGDAGALGALYTSDAWLLPPNADRAEGPEAIAAVFQGYLDAGAKSVKLEIDELYEFGDSAVEVGRYTLGLQPEGAAPVTDQGKYIVFWKNDGGTWKLHRDVWNSNVPAPS